ncbi:MAG: PTS sugar transporter subunit IIA [Pseudomonadota bacterium]
MKLTDMLQEPLIFPDLWIHQKEEALRVMSEGIAKAVPEVDAKDLFATIMEREKLCSTGIGSGIAIPHAKIPKLAAHVMAMGRSRAGIDFGSIDKKPVHLIFMIVGPTASNENHLKALARISKFLHDTNFRDRLLTADSAKKIYDIIADKDAQY